METAGSRDGRGGKAFFRDSNWNTVPPAALPNCN